MFKCLIFEYLIFTIGLTEQLRQMASYEVVDMIRKCYFSSPNTNSRMRKK